MNKRGCLLFLLLILMTALLTACSNSAEPSSSKEEETGENLQETGGNLQIGVMNDPVSLDPHGANENVSNSINSNMYDRLVYLDKNLEIAPGLAESLVQIGETTWEASIRKDVQFHDGSQLNAEVVKANFDRIRDPEIGSPVAFLFNMITEVKVIDDYTVHFETEFPFAPLPSHLAHPGGSIISMGSIEASYEALEKGEDAFTPTNERPIGTGYFKFEDRTPGQSVTLSRHENYWGDELAKVDTVTFQVIPEDLTRIAELETGGIHLTYPVNPSDAERIENGPDTYLEQANSTRMVYLGFNTEVEPFDDPKVRQAIHMAIDKDGILDGVVSGIGIRADGPIAPDVFGFSEQIDKITFDREMAKDLLAEAGYPDGFPTTLLTDDDRERQDLAEMIQYQLSEIGIDVSIDMFEFGTYLERAGNGESELFLGSWGTVTMDGDYGLYPVFHSSNKGSAGNRSFIEHDELDQLLDNARQATDEEERLELYRKAQNVLAEQSPYAYLYYPDSIAGVRNEVEGFFQYPSGFYFLRDVTLKEE
ncbi:glutathione ABC transporter substrate-binding protein [Halalkalibacterium halodurans]|uniref:Oligopeptide ABC transporter (Oligopeptide-binding protein) n=1 Tax=Halalkalibacterium halodurans (strain ATCC BAA-125 / DSM 18197 / FERM 7344 / JCM 9153 / C-125) TaxID=272558 RepID=Q9K996_HALH5|nr:glutathione ABC transporter substrate-binding protein [Halalkalibacterium halodurans]MDY7223305.1 glutathione ABC transporter substrate-binding protein [Halalkalibacterium halodurans]MDY7242526.1 glutathione ABC transporter substrate-binding protein [Halalkalibacterium halodurans]BAB06473.1 oligopeptide ABC transporter (oligopeptide-binding protein) [Halalkalibacterium halodurans C-125]